jgi:hypothetical protein
MRTGKDISITEGDKTVSQLPGGKRVMVVAFIFLTTYLHDLKLKV